MDIIQHAAAGYVMAVAVEEALGLPRNTAVEVASAVAGALPDLIGMAGLVAEKTWRLHESAHDGKIATWLKLLPPYALHLVLDVPTHGDGRRWWVLKERLHYELLGWCAVAVAYGFLN